MFVVSRMQAVKEQFPEDGYDLTQSVVIFSVDLSSLDKDV